MTTPWRIDGWQSEKKDWVSCSTVPPVNPGVDTTVPAGKYKKRLNVLFGIGQDAEERVYTPNTHFLKMNSFRDEPFVLSKCLKCQ